MSGRLAVADRGLLSLENIAELTAVADQDGRKLEFTLAVPDRRYAELVETFQGIAFTEEELAEALRRALALRRPLSDCVFHSDSQGVARRRAWAA